MATFLPSQHRTQTDRFTADGNTDLFYLTHRPVSVYAVRIDGVHKKTGYVGKQFFFLGYEALIDEYTKTLSFAAPPPNTGKKNNIEVVYSYAPVRSATANSPMLGKAPPGQPVYAMYPTPAGAAPAPAVATRGPAEGLRRPEVAGWKESDYLDYADFAKAVEADEPISYALCQWLLRQSYGNVDDAFAESEWHDWYEYALDHCPRFAKEQPRRQQWSNT